MIDYKMDVKWDNKELFEKAPEIFREEKKAVLMEAGLFLEKEIVDRTPVGVTGFLRKSIHTRLTGDQVLVGTSLEYAEPVEYGTKPHYPPVAPLKLWALRKLGDEKIGYAIQKSIGKKGTRPVLMFTRALAMNTEKIVKILESVGERVAQRFKR